MSASPAASLLPWRHTLTIFGAACVLLAIGMIFGRSGSVAALAGYSAGLLGALFSPPRPNWRALAATIVGVGLCLVGPVPETARLSGLFLATLAAFDAQRSGALAAVPALNAMLLTRILPPTDQPAALLIIFVIGAVAGVLVVSFLGLSAAAARPPIPWHRAVARWIFLVVGLGVTSLLVHVLEHQNSYWFFSLFTLRALVPLESMQRSALNFGFGAGLGSISAIALESLGLPRQVLMGIGLVAVVLAIRTIPLRDWSTPACFTLAVLLATSPTIEAALFRIQAVVIVVFLASGLAFAISGLWSFLERTTSAEAGG